ncbi:MAG TPA: class I SAM-dependent methyltransferase [Thermoanaerobaculia bacterium]
MISFIFFGSIALASVRATGSIMSSGMAYDEQDRGDRAAYDRYLRGMNASMKQKVALTAAHLLATGRVADMGMGSGEGTFALAALYPSLQVVGVDINPTMVELARETHALPNLSYVTADIATRCFPDQSLDGVFDSSVLHHVTTFNGYSYEAAANALAAQAAMLKPHGMLIVRDFVAPGEGEVLLDLPANDGDDSDAPRTCATAQLFVRFAREFRRLSDTPGLPFTELEAPRAGWRRFRVSHRAAVEFVLRKDYRADWDTEILEEYTYFSQPQFEETFAGLGLRIVASTPLWNPWIVRNRWSGRFVIRSGDGDELELPPTNYLIAGEKVAADEGVRLGVRGAAEPIGFLRMEHYRNRRSGAIVDLVRRPHPTIDVIPWFAAGDDVFMLARKSYPRPIVGAETTPTIDGSTPSTYVTEPLNVLQQDKPLGRTVVEALGVCALLPPSDVRTFREGCTYYPSPGGVEEEVRSTLVEVEPHFAQTDIPSGSGFSTSGHVRPIEVTQLLRAAQVGALTDARLEINAYHLLQTLGRDPGAWIGDQIEIRSTAAVTPTDVMALLSRRGRRVFEEVRESANFLDLRCATFDEYTAGGDVVSSQRLEYVVPRTLSINTIATALLTRSGDELLMGVDDHDLAAAQSFNGNSDIVVTPAWRLPHAIEHKSDALRWTAERLMREYGVRASRWFDLGGMYHPSPGVTPERVYPFAVETEALAAEGERRLTWIRVRDAVARAAQLRDGHLRIVLFRAAHALGLLGRS